ncbi:MAG: glycosyltransferase family 39 protein [Candidatus Aenigmarchaeota archaeon]|nr:glycosyltransferase family 39 protein [Candidatus Aenigmarchaeota archaeon]
MLLKRSLNYRYEIVLAIFVAVFIIYSSFGITNPWGNEDVGFSAKEKAHYAINYLKFGYIETGLGQKLFEGYSIDTYNQRYSYYVHHPMLISLMVSASFLVFGINEWALRLVPISINIGILIFLFLFVKTYWNKKIAVLASFFAVFFPTFFFNRHLPAFEVLSLFFICVILYIYAKWLKTNDKRYFYLIFISFAIGTLSDWQTYFVIPPILIHYFIFVNKRNKERKLLYLIPFAFLTFGLYILYVFLLSGDTGGTGMGGDLWGALLLRTNMNESAWICNITIPMIINRIIHDISIFYTPMFLFIPVIFVVILIYKIIKKANSEKYALPFLLFLFYMGYLFIFSHGYLASEFLILFLIPPMAIFTPIIIKDLWLWSSRKLKRKNINKLRIAFSIALAIFAGFYLSFAYPMYNDFYRLNNLYLPLNTFLSENRDNIIVSFIEDSTFYQLRAYLDMRIVREIATNEELIKLLEGDIEFGYFFVKKDQAIDDNLWSYLTDNFPNTEMYNIDAEHYIIFDMKNKKI